VRCWIGFGFFGGFLGYVGVVGVMYLIRMVGDCFVSLIGFCVCIGVVLGASVDCLLLNWFSCSVVGLGNLLPWYFFLNELEGGVARVLIWSGMFGVIALYCWVGPISGDVCVGGRFVCGVEVVACVCVTCCALLWNSCCCCFVGVMSLFRFVCAGMLMCVEWAVGIVAMVCVAIFSHGSCVVGYWGGERTEGGPCLPSFRSDVLWVYLVTPLPCSPQGPVGPSVLHSRTCLLERVRRFVVLLFPLPVL